MGAKLYQDNAGGLFLARTDWTGEMIGPIYSGFEAMTGASFASDANALDAGDTGSWTLEEVEAVPETATVVAEWAERRPITLDLVALGAAARRYIFGV